MNNNPLVSVIIPCYNHAQFVQETIQSVIDQDYENIELIIIDDGSKDNSVEVIKQMIPACEVRFKRFEFRYRSNKGLCKTLNESLEWCKGKYYAPIASDDILIKNKTSHQVKYLEKNKKSVGVFGNIELLSSKTKKKPLFQKKIKKYYFDDILTHKHKIFTPTQLLRLEAVKNTKGYPEDSLIEDWSMWLLLTRAGCSLDHLNRKFVFYRRHDSNTSSKIIMMKKAREKILKTYKENKKYNYSKSRIDIVYAHDAVKTSPKKAYFIITKTLRKNILFLFDFYFLKLILRLCKRKFYF